ncbi:MAG: RAMP superfamily CRISPR-associated protein [Streptosporangiaceae bacterium]
MRFQILFHGPFRVATGSAAEGLDATYAPDAPLPASSLKGLMRAHAKQQLDLDDRLVNEVFGGRTAPRCPWSWTDVEFTGNLDHRIRTQARIDPETFTTTDGAMFTTGELWPTAAEFEILQRDAVDPARIELHQMVLTASARAITALGSDRRRGLGWVSVLPDLPWSDRLHELLITSRSAHA